MSSFQVQQQQHLVRGNQAQQTCPPGQTSISVPLYNNPMVFSQTHPITVAAQTPTDGSERQPQSDYSQDRSLRYERSPAGTVLMVVTENSNTWAEGRAGTSGLRGVMVSGCHRSLGAGAQGWLLLQRSGLVVSPVCVQAGCCAQHSVPSGA